MAEIQRTLLATKSFSTNLVYFLPLYIMLLLVTCTSALLQARFPKCTGVHLKRFGVHENSCTKNYNL